MKPGDTVSLTALAIKDGTPYELAVKGVIEGIDPTPHGQRFRVRDAAGHLTVVTSEEYAATWI